MVSKLPLAALFFTFTLLTNPSFAQQQGTASPTVEEPILPPPPPEPILPYDGKLLRLSELLGSLHYLRPLCQANEGPIWRDFMNKIITSEQPTPKRRARLISRFNRGYRGFNSSYSTCTPSAIIAANKYRDEAISIIDQIDRRYGQ